MKLVLLTVLVGLVYGATVEKGPKFGQEMVDYVNGLNGSFKARRYPQYLEDRFHKYTEFLSKNSNKIEAESKRSKRQASPVNQQVVGDEPIPESFDIATQWPQCAKVFRRLIDSGTCYGAITTIPITSMITDRRCIVSNGTLKVPISAWDVITCFYKDEQDIDNCEEYTHFTFLSALDQYTVQDGIVTGGAYETEQFKSHGCKPWPLSLTQDHTTVNKTCVQECRPQYTERTYVADKRTGTTNWTFIVVMNDTAEQVVEREIMQHGSVMLWTRVYDSYFQYSSGIYQQNAASQTTEPTILVYLRLQGWGVENGVKYWKAATTFGPNWGEKGYVKFARGDYIYQEVHMVTALVN